MLCFEPPFAGSGNKGTCVPVQHNIGILPKLQYKLDVSRRSLNSVLCSQLVLEWYLLSCQQPASIGNHQEAVIVKNLFRIAWNGCGCGMTCDQLSVAFVAGSQLPLFGCCCTGTWILNPSFGTGMVLTFEAFICWLCSHVG